MIGSGGGGPPRGRETVVVVRSNERRLHGREGEVAPDRRRGSLLVVQDLAIRRRRRRRVAGRRSTRGHEKCEIKSDRRNENRGGGLGAEVEGRDEGFDGGKFSVCKSVKCVGVLGRGVENEEGREGILVRIDVEGSGEKIYAQK